MDVDNILSIITGKDEVDPQRATQAKYQSGSATGGSDSSKQAKQKEKKSEEEGSCRKKKKWKKCQNGIGHYLHLYKVW